MESAVMDLISVLGVLAGSLTLGFLKGHTSALDGRIGDAIKPVQPVLVSLAGLGLPYLTEALGVGTVSPEVFVTAPTATVVAVAAREIALRVRGTK